MTSSLDMSVEGQAVYGTANLRPERTGLPFIVFVSQRDDARHAARVNVSPAPKVRSDQMGSYAIRPKAGRVLSRAEGGQLEAWLALNQEVIERYWDGDIEFTEDALAQLRPI